MPEKIILGIDPGTNLLGFGVIAIYSGQPRYVDMGVLDIRKEPDHFAKLKALTVGVGELLDRYNPTAMSIESPFVDKNPQVMLKLGRAQGAAIVEALIRNIPVYEYAPRKAKIAITGNGGATKQQVASMVQSILGIDEQVKHLDATDALAIALCHHYDFVSPLTGGSTGGSKGSSRGHSSWEQFIAENPSRVEK